MMDTIANLEYTLHVSSLTHKFWITIPSSIVIISRRVGIYSDLRHQSKNRPPKNPVVKSILQALYLLSFLLYTARES